MYFQRKCVTITLYIVLIVGWVTKRSAMIAFLHGELYQVTDNSAIVECAGVGYEAMMPQSDLEALPETGATVRLFTYLNVSENTGVSLFGFLEEETLRMFRLLITVSGVGPKVALGILSALPTQELAYAICTDNVKAIVKAPGVGAKLAGKIILELRDKVKPEELIGESVKPATGKADETAAEEAISGLTALGYTRKDAEKAVRRVAGEGMSAEQILDAAFRFL